MKRSSLNKKILVILAAVVLTAAVAAGAVYLANRTTIVAGLEALEDDPGNLPDDDFTARY